MRWHPWSSFELWSFWRLQTCHMQMLLLGYMLTITDLDSPYSLFSLTLHANVTFCSLFINRSSCLSLSPSRLPDPLHAYLGLCGLSLIGEPSLRKVHPALNITQRAFQHLQQLQQTWGDNTGSFTRQHWQQDDPRLRLWTGSGTSNRSQTEATGPCWVSGNSSNYIDEWIRIVGHISIVAL